MVANPKDYAVDMRYSNELKWEGVRAKCCSNKGTVLTREGVRVGYTRCMQRRVSRGQSREVRGTDNGCGPWGCQKPR